MVGKVRHNDEWMWVCIAGCFGYGYATEQDAEDAELEHDCAYASAVQEVPC